MIITEETAKPPVKSNGSDPEGGQSSATTPPPPYPSNTPYQNAPSQNVAYQQHPVTQPILSRPAIAVAAHQSPAARFFKAFAVAVLIWLLAGMFARSIVDLVHSSHHRYYQINPPNDIGWPSASDGNVGMCIGGRDWPTNNAPGRPYPDAYHSETSFRLPASSNLLFLLARGSLSSGSIKILSSLERGYSVTVDVAVRYSSPGALDRANVCLLYRSDGNPGAGIGIFTPLSSRPSWTMMDQLQFDITVYLPASDEYPLSIHNFETNLPHFHHKVGLLQGVVDFHSLSLRTTNMPVEAGSLSSELMTIKTSNGPISGTFNATSSLSLVTSNANIKADVGLQSDSSAKLTELLLKTSNGVVDTAISLLTSRSSGGSYKVVATTSNSHLDINFPTQPPDSILLLDAKTSNSPATVALDPAYEGTFSLTSSITGPSLETREASDPSRRNRQRTVDYRRANSRSLDGSVWWEYPKIKAGSVKLKTSNSPALLKL